MNLPKEPSKHDRIREIVRLNSDQWQKIQEIRNMPREMCDSGKDGPTRFIFQRS